MHARICKMMMFAIVTDLLGTCMVHLHGAHACLHGAGACLHGHGLVMFREELDQESGVEHRLVRGSSATFLWS